MSDEQAERPDPQKLLKLAKRKEAKTLKGKLKIFMGMSAGVGKTYAMLQAGAQQLKKGVDVLVGVVETHGRVETAELLKPLPRLSLTTIEYRGMILHEFDLSAMLRRKPQLALIDELAHSNVPGSRHKKRYQDVLELLESGIDVYTTLNIQHIESRKDIIEGITGTVVNETVPDMILETADEIQLIDLSPVQLMRRLQEGKVYLGQQPQIALQNFFKEENLTALREIALRYLAEQVDTELSGLVSYYTQKRFHTASEILLVAISPSQHSENLARATKRLAHILNAPWFAVWIDLGNELELSDKEKLAHNLALAGALGAEVITISARSFVEGLTRAAKQVNATKIIMGRPEKISLKEYLTEGSVLDKLASQVSDVDLYILRKYSESGRSMRPFFLLFALSTPIKHYLFTALYVVLLTVFAHLALPWVGYKAVGFVFLLGILLLSLWTYIVPIFMAASASALIWLYYFIPPIHTFEIYQPEDISLFIINFIVALITGILVSRVRHSHKKLEAQEQRTYYLYEALKAISETRDIPQLKQTLMPILAKAISGTIEIIIAKGTRSPQLNFAGSTLSQKEESVADWVINKRKPAGWSTDTLSSSEYFFLPLISFDKAVGVLSLKPSNPAKPLDIYQINLLQTIARPLAIFIERRLRDTEKAKASYDTQIDHIKKMMDKYIEKQQRAPAAARPRLTVGQTPVSFLKPTEIGAGLCSVEELIALALDVGRETEQPLDFLVDNRCGEINLELDLGLFEVALKNMLMVTSEIIHSNELVVIFSNKEKNFVVKVKPKIPPQLQEDEQIGWDQFLETNYATQLAILHAVATNLKGSFAVVTEDSHFVGLSLQIPQHNL